MTKEERDTIEQEADRILNIFDSQNMADIPGDLFHRLANKFHVLTTILERESINLEAKRRNTQYEKHIQKNW